MKSGLFLTSPHRLFRRIITFSLLACFLFFETNAPHIALAQITVSQHPQVLSPSPTHVPPHLIGMSIHPDNPLVFDFMVDDGNATLTAQEQQEVYQRLIHYFMTALTMPEEHMWVNLSPAEHDRIIDGDFAHTELGRDLLKQDYLLKQFTSSMLYPEQQPGEQFWTKVFAKAYERFGTTEIPLDAFHKIWIIPDMAEVYEDKGMAVIGQSHLKVLLEEDYVLAKQEQGNTLPIQLNDKKPSPVGDLVASVLRDVVVPAIEEEVNHHEYFAPLRQIYQSYILAAWFKRRLKNSVYGKTYMDQEKIAGMEIDDKTVKNRIYQQYLDTYRQGVYNYIKEQHDPFLDEIIPRRYFSGGVQLQADQSMIIKPMSQSPILRSVSKTFKRIRVFNQALIRKTIMNLHEQGTEDNVQATLQSIWRMNDTQRRARALMNFTTAGSISDNGNDIIVTWRSRGANLIHHRIVIHGAAALLEQTNPLDVIPAQRANDLKNKNMYRIESLLDHPDFNQQQWRITVQETPSTLVAPQTHEGLIDGDSLHNILLDQGRHATETYSPYENNAETDFKNNMISLAQTVTNNLEDTPAERRFIITTRLDALRQSVDLLRRELNLRGALREDIIKHLNDYMITLNATNQKQTPANRLDLNDLTATMNAIITPDTDTDIDALIVNTKSQVARLLDTIGTKTTTSNQESNTEPLTQSQIQTVSRSPASFYGRMQQWAVNTYMTGLLALMMSSSVDTQDLYTVDDSVITETAPVVLPKIDDMVQVDVEQNRINLFVPEMLDGASKFYLTYFLTGSLSNDSTYEFSETATTNRLKKGAQVQINDSAFVEYEMTTGENLNTVVENLFGNQQERKRFYAMPKQLFRRLVPQDMTDYHYWTNPHTPITKPIKVYAIMHLDGAERLEQRAKNNEDLNEKINIIFSTEDNTLPLIDNDNNENNVTNNDTVGGIDFDQNFLQLKTNGESINALSEQQLDWLTTQPVAGFQSIIMNVQETGATFNPHQ